MNSVPPPVARRLETPRAAAVAGLVFTALFVASMLLTRNHPAGGSTAAEISEFYLDENAGKGALVGLQLVPFAGIAFLWFIAVIRNLLGEREDRFFATVFLGSGLLFVAMLFVGSGVSGALLFSVKLDDQPVPSADAVVLVRSIGFLFLHVYAVKMAAVFMIVVSTIGMRLRLFPRWLVLAGFGSALVLLLNVVHAAELTLVFPAWVAALSIVIIRAAPTRAPSA